MLLQFHVDLFIFTQVCLKKINSDDEIEHIEKLYIQLTLLILFCPAIPFPLSLYQISLFYPKVNIIFSVCVRKPIIIHIPAVTNEPRTSPRKNSFDLL